MPADRPLRALVTAGGTQDAIDDVRVITNLSTGRFGLAIASALADLGVEVTLLAGPAALARARDPRLKLIPFAGFADLRARLAEAAETGAELVLMAAAVSDYSPAPHEGKLSSKDETLTLTLTRNPKLLDSLRAAFGEATIVGFKLLSGVSREELEAVARRQCERAELDLTVANDLAELGGEDHPVLLVPREGEARRIEGPRAEVAAAIARATLALRGAEAEAGGALRAADWAALGGAREVASAPGTSLAGRVKAAFPGLSQVAVGGFIALGELGRAYDEDDGALARIAQGHHRGLPLHRGFGLEHSGGGLLGLPPGAGRSWRARWDALAESLRPVLPGGWRLRPVFWETELVGAAATLATSEDGDRPCAAPMILPEQRGRGLGDRLLLAFDSRGWDLAIPPEDAQLAAFAIERGFGQPTMQGGLRVLRAPSRRRDAIRAASLCLYAPGPQLVLMGRRRTAPWRGYWAFPGGRAELGETRLDAARREFEEETGLRAPVCEPLASTTVNVASPPDGRRFYRVTNFQVLTLETPEPRPTEELEARWVPVSELAELAPMAAGTRRILTQVLRLIRGERR